MQDALWLVKSGPGHPIAERIWYEFDALDAPLASLALAEPLLSQSDSHSRGFDLMSYVRRKNGVHAPFYGAQVWKNGSHAETMRRYSAHGIR